MLPRWDPPHSSSNPRRHSRHSSSSETYSAIPHATNSSPDSHPHYTAYTPPFQPQFGTTNSSSPMSLGEKNIFTRSNSTASRMISSVRRSLGSYVSKRRHAESYQAGFYSALEHRNQRFAFTPSHLRFRDAYSTRPTVEQIAMGLHVSRTPHLRPVGGRRRTHGPPSPPLHVSHDMTPTGARSAPPTRSSLKKSSTLTSSSTMTPGTTPVLSTASMSTSTIASVTPSIAKSTRSILSLKSRMSRFFPGTRSASAHSPVSDLQSETNPNLPRKKAVRFSSSTPGLDNTTTQWVPDD